MGGFRRTALWVASGLLWGKELEGKGRVYGVDKLEFVSLELGFDWYGKELGCFGRGGGGGRGSEEREKVRRLG